MPDNTAAAGSSIEADSEPSPYAVARARVDAVEQITPSFVRIRFSGDSLQELGNPGRNFDQRIKLIFPSPGHGPAPLEGSGDEWYRVWLDLPEHSRGSIRTYTIRTLELDADAATRVVVDFALHPGGGELGPASRWASAAVPGDELLIVGPRRGSFVGGGIEYDPGDAATVMLAGDETAAPAIASILEDADRSSRGIAFIEVPLPADRMEIAAPPGFEVRWLPRNGAAHGSLLIPAVLEQLEFESATVEVEDSGTADPLWETPTFSGLGERLDEHLEGPDTVPSERWFWLAGESGVVTTLRRQLVRELRVDRADVAFMGYWRHGVAMRG
ncbi:siderophore-interacting protein [Leucobacter sp. CSA2]|uniref:Siderophore-interacting protein n=1 Tax=Leucobacter edaphi TaxID=2796472 RepID=A0A934QEH2_9MICO|nr:siderophore-interacting protein [Leucobacter edaphi]MBK0421812.1 siderophore-interacting protein [Leucobacter edaphi]